MELNSKTPTPAPSNIHHGTFLTRDFMSFSTELPPGCDASGFTLSFVMEKHRMNSKAHIRPTTAIVYCQEAAVETPSELWKNFSSGSKMARAMKLPP